MDNPAEFLVYQALRRTGLAYDFADLVSYEVHQEWVDWLFQEMSKEPVKGFQRTQLAQILRADKAAWLHLADTVRDIRPSAGARPLDMAFASLPAVHSVIFNLMPTPLWFAPQGKGKGTWGGKSQGGKGYASTERRVAKLVPMAKDLESRILRDRLPPSRDLEFQSSS